MVHGGGGQGFCDDRNGLARKKREDGERGVKIFQKLRAAFMEDLVRTTE